jgi:hypothetical protein
MKKFPDRWTVEIVIGARKPGAETPSKAFPWGIYRLGVLHG